MCTFKGLRAWDRMTANFLILRYNLNLEMYFGMGFEPLESFVPPVFKTICSKMQVFVYFSVMQIYSFKLRTKKNE